MVYGSLFLLNFVPLSLGKSTTSIYTQLFHPTNYFPSTIQCNYTPKRAFPSPRVASIATPTLYNPPSVNMDYFETEFSGHGVTFEDISDNCVVKMALDDGSTTSLMLPSGLITSYKAPMWHGGTLELLHTYVSESKNSEEEDDVLIQGGVSLAFTCKSDAERGVSWSPNTWTLHNVKGDPQELIQVELVSISNAMDTVQLKHIVTLRQGLLSSEIVISNQKSSPIGVMGYIMSHLNVSTPEAAYVLGLEGSDFYSRPPISSDFSIIPPLEPSSVKKDSDMNEFWGPLSEIFSMFNGRTRKQGVREETEGEESDNYKHLTDRMSRIYTSAPQCFTLIDRGKRNSVEVERNGFNELYLFSPGSTHKWYGKYAYICFGQSALLEPIFLAPGGEWRGLQVILVYSPIEEAHREHLRAVLSTLPEHWLYVKFLKWEFWLKAVRFLRNVVSENGVSITTRKFH